jgi:hypothetical protein
LPSCELSPRLFASLVDMFALQPDFFHRGAIICMGSLGDPKRVPL